MEVARRRVQALAQESQSPSRSLCPLSEGDVPSHFSPHSLPDTIYTVQTFSKESINESRKSEEAQAYVSNNTCLLLKVMEILSWGKMKDDNGAMYGYSLFPF